MKRMVTGFLMGGALLLSASQLRAQVAWDGPMLVSPSAPAGWAIYLVDPSPGDGIGVLATWRAGGPLGYRLGLAEDPGDKVSVYGGVDYSRPLMRASDDFPVDVSWFTGGGVGVGDGVLLSVPLGVSFGVEMEAEGIWFHPSISPRVVLDAPIGGERPRDDLSLDFAVDLGIDVSFDPGWAVRFGGSIGDRSAIAIGISFRVF